MAIPIGPLYDEICSIVRTTQNGIMRPKRDFETWVNTIQYDIYNELYRQLEETQEISDKLMPFLKSVNVMVTPVKNQMYDLVEWTKATKPGGPLENYINFASARLREMDDSKCGCDESLDILNLNTCKILSETERQEILHAQDQYRKEYNITKVKNNRWSALSSRRTLKPSIKNAYMTQFDGGFKILPKDTGIIIMDFLRLPAAAVYNYTIQNPYTEDEYIQFNPQGSVDLEWPVTMREEFIGRLVQKYATSVGNTALFQEGVVTTNNGK